MKYYKEPSVDEERAKNKRRKSSHYIHFDSVEDFHKQTNNEDNLKELLRSLVRVSCLKETTATSQIKAWRDSLPDFSDFLYDPKLYFDKTEEYLEQLEKDCLREKEIETLLEQFQETTNYDLPWYKRHAILSFAEKEAFVNACNIISEVLPSLKEKPIVKRIQEAINRYKEYSKSKAKNKEPFPNDLKIDLEVPLFGAPGTRGKPKRVDILLTYNNRIAVIEQKNWTEDSVHSSMDNPAKQANEYVDRIKKHPNRFPENTGKEVRGFGYLHNHIMPKDRSDTVGDWIQDSIKQNMENGKQNKPDRYPYLYTRIGCLNFYKELQTFLTGSDS